MKKTQVALAALALVASTAALADVTVYGNLDAGVAVSDGKVNFYGDGNNATTLFGLKGSEDLGSGLKVNWNLESGLDIAGGATNGPNGGGNKNLFNRAAWIGVDAGGYGVNMGNQFSNVVLAALVNGATAVGGDGANIGTIVRVFGGAPGLYDATGAASSVFFIPSAVQAYANVGGVSVNYMTRLQERDTSNSSYNGVTAATSFAGVNAAIGYQSGVYAVGTSNYSSTFLAANTTFEGLNNLRVNGVYAWNGDALTKNGYMVGASMPLVGALSAGITYADGGTAALGSQTVGSLQYGLSKQTLVYLNHAHSSVAGKFMGNTGTSVTGKDLTTIGLKHSF